MSQLSYQGLLALIILLASYQSRDLSIMKKEPKVSNLQNSVPNLTLSKKMLWMQWAGMANIEVPCDGLTILKPWNSHYGSLLLDIT